MDETRLIEVLVRHEQEGSYFLLPFQIPEGLDVETLTIKYRYTRYASNETTTGVGLYRGHSEINIIDLGLIGPDGSQVGASGSDKAEVFISETGATPGYRPTALVPGEWQILLGAYKVEAQGVQVSVELHFVEKRARWLKGDLHTHTLASDGVLSAEELGRHAVRHGLDFVAITDHNQMVSAEALPQIPGLTLIPGIEWTHYQGHANFLGVDRPYDGVFATNTAEEARAHFESARARGALITINHPFEACCEFKFDVNSLPFDCLEIWNGPMRESNLKAVGLWHSWLMAGRKIPVCGGSDYHRDTPFLFLGGPTTCVYATSAGQRDILAALRQGHAYIVFAPNGPALELMAGANARMGDSVAWDEVKAMKVTVSGLLAGDVVRVVTPRGSETLVQTPAPGEFETVYTMAAPGFARIEVLRAFLPGLPLLPALISNPIYFEG
jgi:hypothetical protein